VPSRDPAIPRIRFSARSTIHDCDRNAGIRRAPEVLFAKSASPRLSRRQVSDAAGFPAYIRREVSSAQPVRAAAHAGVSTTPQLLFNLNHALKVEPLDHGDISGFEAVDLK
jgi:hypothetical protein